MGTNCTPIYSSVGRVLAAAAKGQKAKRAGEYAV
jgi:hypothetical protein